MTDTRDSFVNVRPVIVADAPDAHQVWLDIGVQHFTIGEYCETKEDAEWHAAQLRIALTALQAGAGDGERLDALDELRDMMVQPDRQGEPELVGYYWCIQGQCETVREAIDGMLKAKAQASGGEMSRIDEINNSLSWHAGNIHYSQQIIVDLAKELAAIEAQERKPREYVVYVDPKTGNITQHKLSAMFGSEEITVIEKLPVKLTNKTARAMADYYEPRNLGPLNYKEAAINVLKIAGIDAEPSND